MSKHNSGTPRVSNYIPAHIGNSVVSDLRDLVFSQLESGPKVDYLREHIFSKYMDSTVCTPRERRRAAIEKWLGIEKQNLRTNTRILIDDADFGYCTSDALFSKTKEYIARVLGPLDLERVLRNSNHTSGASTRIRRQPDAAFHKYTGKAQVTQDALPLWLMYAQNTVLSEQEVELVESSVLFTVPKKSDIDRVAAKEPEINMLLQRAAGAYIRKRLRRTGCNLNDQTINQNLAKDALRLGLGTIDLSSASDSISTQLIYRLLPYDWFVLLDTLRVKSTLIKDDKQQLFKHELHMFSSMGNGFTFELESLVFLSLVRAICYFSRVKGKISVYGDDIIAPSVICARVKRTFSFLGFRVNEEKSYWTGPLRESCGKHYHLSLDVTPFYVKGPIRTKTDLMKLLNQIVKWDRYVFSDINVLPYNPNYFVLQTTAVKEFHQKWKKLIPTALHGGQDVESTTSLVTGDLPNKRIRRQTIALCYPDFGAYIWWLQEKERIPWFTGLACDPREESTHWIMIDNIRRGSESPWNLYDSSV